MATVSFQTSDHELRKEQKPITFWAKNSKGMVGRLVVSKGGLRWYSGKSTKKHTYVSWERLDRQISEIGKAGK